MATTEEDCEQTDGPTHGHLSAKGKCSYRAWGKMKREEGYWKLVSRLGLEPRALIERRRGMPGELAGRSHAELR